MNEHHSLLPDRRTLTGDGEVLPERAIEGAEVLRREEKGRRSSRDFVQRTREQRRKTGGYGGRRRDDPKWACLRLEKAPINLSVTD